MLALLNSPPYAPKQGKLTSICLQGFSKIHQQLIFEPQHEISNNVVCVASKSSDQQSDLGLSVNTVCMQFKTLSVDKVEKCSCVREVSIADFILIFWAGCKYLVVQHLPC